MRLVRASYVARALCVEDEEEEAEGGAARRRRRRCRTRRRLNPSFAVSYQLLTMLDLMPYSHNTH